MPYLTTAWMKIYTAAGAYVAACNDIAGAAALMAFYGDGAEIRNGHAKQNVIWREGVEQQSAAESYDFVVATVNERMAPVLRGMTDHVHVELDQFTFANFRAALRVTAEARQFVRRLVGSFVPPGRNKG